MAVRQSRAALISRAAKISAALATLYPEARISLDFETPWQCLAATILSAQCTDERVNKVTPALFREFPDARATAAADAARVRELVATTGFFRQKAKSLISTAKLIVERHGGEVPSELDDLVKLKGVGRKTANLVVTEAYRKPGICVDTHVHRISNRWGLVRTRNPDQSEAALREVLPRRHWLEYNRILVAFGQTLCHPVSPRCSQCPVAHRCPRIGVGRSR